MLKRIYQYEPLIGKDEKKAVQEYLDSGGWLTEFERTREFEKAISNYLGSQYTSVVSNGTVSLTIALMALGIKSNDDVIVPDFTMIASANSVVLAGAKPVLVDISRDNLCLNLDKVEEAITPRTKAIMYVSLNGRCSDMQKVAALARRHGLFLIEDAAQSFGSKCQGKSLGTFGDIGSFSFSSPKIITTGQGGALVTDKKELYDKVQLIKDFGRAKAGVDLHQTMGYNFKFTDLQAVIGIEQMKNIEWRVKRKKEIFKIYRDLLKSVPQVKFIETNLVETTPWFVDIIVAKGREKLVRFLGERGIGTRPFYPAIHTQQPYIPTIGNFENSEFVSQSGLWLPSSLILADEDIEHVCKEIIEHFKV